MTATWSMGPGTLAVPLSLFAENRARLAAKLEKGQVVLLQGGENLNLYDTDVEYVFRQESYFTWICGVREPGCYFALDVASNRSILFVPQLPPEYAVWMGRLLTLEDFKKIYAVDEVHYVNDIAKVLGDLKPETLLTLSGVNSDSGLSVKEASFPEIFEVFMRNGKTYEYNCGSLNVLRDPLIMSGSEDYVSERHKLAEFCGGTWRDGINTYTDRWIGKQVNNSILFPIVAELRVIKTKAELAVLRYVTKVSSDAHKQVMLYVRPGRNEYECESVFLHHCYSVGGCRHVSYTCICGSGPNGSVLHYGHAGAPNTRILKNGDMCLYDMGGNYAGYASDITCSFPANGKFTSDQKLIYEAVLAARDAVLREAQPGVLWDKLHLTANIAMLEHLKSGGLLKGDVNEMIKAGLNGIFQPHGLGHLLGLDVHDVGGYLTGCPPRPQGALCRLRMARELIANMVVTVEPGCYFIDPLLDAALDDPKQVQFINTEMLQRFRGFGGVRIEDDVIITKSGVENMTVVPRTVKEIEAHMSTGANFVEQ